MPRPSDPFARDRLLQAAQRVFAEKGLDRAKVEDIAQQAGLSKGAFYLHFESKDEAFREVVKGVLERLAAFLDEDACGAKRGQRPTAEEFLHAWVDVDCRIFEYVWENRTLVRLTLEGGRSADYQHLVDHFADRVEKHIGEMLRIGVDFGMYRASLNFKATAAFIAGGYDRFARQLVREPERPDVERCVRDLQAVVIRGVGTLDFIERIEELRAARGVEGLALEHQPDLLVGK